MQGLAQTVDTPDGPFTMITSTAAEVLASGWNTGVPELLLRIHPSIRPQHVSAGESQAALAVEAYYSGDTRAVAEFAVLQKGTELQQLGWAALREITPGAPVNYAEFAKLIGRPSAVRAAAAICARNAAGLFTPCHRVLRSDGGLGGFAWGTEVKRALLAREAH